MNITAAKSYIFYATVGGQLNISFQLRNVCNNEVGFKHEGACLLRFESGVEAPLLGFFETPCLDGLAVRP
jgi:hypothetical protein